MGVKLACCREQAPSSNKDLAVDPKTKNAGREGGWARI